MKPEAWFAFGFVISRSIQRVAKSCGMDREALCWA
ncbi:MAG: hypothetical protein RIS92_6 [Verrucomicrobiota bacterium]|jgi:hypothetical protein